MIFIEEKEIMKKRIFDIIDRLDKSGKNHKIYNDLFNNMSDKEFISFCKTGTVRLFTSAYDDEPKLEDALKTCEYMGVPVMEPCTIPFLHSDSEDGDLYADKECLVLPVTYRRLEQLISKENSSATSISHRNDNNQVVGDSKAAVLSDVEVAMLVARGADKLIQEMLTFRADHTGSKEEAYSNIRNTGETNLPDSINDPTNKTALQKLHWFYVGMGLSTDIIEDL